MTKAHHCRGPLPCVGDAAAVSECFEDEDGHFRVFGDNYGSIVMFCPYCGDRAPTGPVLDVDCYNPDEMERLRKLGYRFKTVTIS